MRQLTYECRGSLRIFLGRPDGEWYSARLTHHDQHGNPVLTITDRGRDNRERVRLFSVLPFGSFVSPMGTLTLIDERTADNWYHDN